MKELRLNFSDYPAEEQEKDTRRKRIIQVPKHAYLMKVDGVWAHLIVNQAGDEYRFYEDMNLIQVYYELKKNKPGYKPKVIKNEGLEAYLRNKKLPYRQLRIPFNDMFSMSKRPSRE